MPTPSAKKSNLIILDDLDQKEGVDADTYKKKLKEYQLSLLNLQLRLSKTKRSVVKPKRSIPPSLRMAQSYRSFRTAAHSRCCRSAI